MANYTTSASEHTKSGVLKAWAIGIFGVLGFHFFKVGKIKHGIVRLIYGLFMLIATIKIAFDASIPTFGTVVMFAFLLFPSIVDLCKILLGVFRDNVGNAVRES